MKNTFQPRRSAICSSFIVALRQWGEKYFHDETCGGEKLIDRAERKVVPPVRV